jgi:hypothetical protein
MGKIITAAGTAKGPSWIIFTARMFARIRQVVNKIPVTMKVTET